MARLDRLYLFQQALSSRASMVNQYIIRGDGVWSDHCLVHISLQLEDGHNRIAKWKMNSNYLEEALPELQQIWRSKPINAFFYLRFGQ